jgi:hypothetical protein
MTGFSDEAPPTEADIGAGETAALANDGAGPAFCAPVASAFATRSETDTPVAGVGEVSAVPGAAAPVEPAPVAGCIVGTAEPSVSIVILIRISSSQNCVPALEVDSGSGKVGDSQPVSAIVRILPLDGN